MSRLNQLVAKWSSWCVFIQFGISSKGFPVRDEIIFVSCKSIQQDFLIPVAPLEKYDKRVHGRLPLKRHRVMIVTLCKRLPWEVNFLIYLSKKCQGGTKYIRKFKKKLTKQKSHLTWYCPPTVPTTGSYREASQRLFHLFQTFSPPCWGPQT